MEEASELQYLENVENGFITGLAYNSEVEEGSKELLEQNIYSPDTFLETSEDGINYDNEFSAFRNTTINADKVKIDSTQGVFDVIQNDELKARYALLGVIEENGDSTAYFSADIDGETYLIGQSDNSLGNWGPETAAVYEGLEHIMDLEPTRLDADKVPVRDLEDTDTADWKRENYGEAAARSDLKLINKGLGNLEELTPDDLIEFEEQGVANIKKDTHPFGSSGPRCFDAARQFKSIFSDLKKAGILDYEIVDPDRISDEKKAKVMIDPSYHNGNKLQDEVNGVSDFVDEVETFDELFKKAVKERFRWKEEDEEE